MTAQDQGNHNADTVTVMMDRLADAAWAQLAEIAPRDMDIDEIADEAGTDRGAARAVAGSISALVLHQTARLDRQAAVESFADIEDAGDVPIRDKIMEAMMHRFEIYAPYKAQIRMLNRAARRDPALALRLLDSLAQAMRRILLMAGDDLAGIRGEARLRGVAAVAMLVARVWQNDESPDMAATMKEIDRRLAQAEEWGRSLRVFGGSGPTSADDPHAPGDPGAGDTGGGDNFNPPSDERWQ